MINWRRMLDVRAIFVLALAVLMASCSDDKVAGGTTEDAGLAIKNLDVAGLAQKGPFVKGSVVTLQGVDCKTMNFTDELFEGSVINNDGEYVVENVNLSVACALLEVTGYYLNENTGKKSMGEISLHALTDLSDRKNVNINVFTELEYKRVMNLVTKKKMSFADAKKQAEKEVLAAFDVNANDGDSALFEDLDVFEKGKENVALHDVSVMLQADLDATKLAERLENIAADIAKDGKWDDRASVIPASSGNLPSSSSSKPASSSSSSPNVILSSSEGSSNDTKDSYLNPNINYGEMTDPRDGQVYKTVKIGDQIWMAQNLNYADSVKMPSLKGKSWCFNNDPEKCAIGGRLYTWAAAIDSVKLATDKDNPVDCGDGKLCGLIGPLQGVCPDGWFLPSEKEWSKMWSVVADGVSQDKSGVLFKTKTGWSGNGNGTDVAGFSAIPAGYRNGSFISWGSVAYFWSSAEDNGYLADWDYNPAIAHNRSVNTTDYWSMGGVRKSMGQSVRCVKGESAPVFLEKEESPKDTYLNPNIKYDSIVDPRDGKVYKTVKIGDYVWMAQNLSYKTTGRYCYKDSVKYCNIYGGLYTWSAAVGNSESECKSKESCKIQGICPDGWHMPDTTEWKKLYLSEGDSGYVLQAKGFKNWAFATDDYGFSALPAGNWFNDGYYNFGYTADFWMATRKNGGEPYYWDLDYDAERTGFKTLISSQMRLSIRCLKDYDFVTSSSSSSVRSSSSIEALPACKTETEDNCEYGTLKDARDGQTYKTVKIGNQIWMAENLNYAYTSIPYKYEENGEVYTSDSVSWCYDNDPANCAKFGRLYTWAAAMDSVKTGCGNGKVCGLTGTVQGICPTGWHLPNMEEWFSLFLAVGGDPEAALGSHETAGLKLKSQSGWNNDGNCVSNSDAFGFSAVPVGFRNFNGDFRDHPLRTYNDESVCDGLGTWFWTSMDQVKDDADVIYLYGGTEGAYHNCGEKYLGFSVRCVKD